MCRCHWVTVDNSLISKIILNAFLFSDHLSRKDFSINESLGESSYQQLFQWLFYMLLVNFTVRREGIKAETELTFWSLLPSSVLSTISLSLGQNKAHFLTVDFSTSAAQKLVYLCACVASTVSSQILLTHLFLLLANLPGLFGGVAFFFTLLLLPPLFVQLRFRFLPRCLSNLTHATDLCVYKREPPIQKVFDGFFDFGAFIQSLQLQSSKFQVNDRFVQNRSHRSLFQENLIAHIILQLLSLLLTCFFAFAADNHNSLDSLNNWIGENSFPPPSIALTGSPAFYNFLIVSSILGPGLWVVSQILLVLYYKLDNGANTCGIDFHFENDKVEGALAEVEVKENEENIPLNSRVETEDVPEESSSIVEDDSTSIITDEEPRGDKYFEFRVLEKLFISEFKVVSEEGRWVDPQFGDENQEEEEEPTVVVVEQA